MIKVRKKRLLNTLMTVLIAAIALAGVMAVGSVRGWFVGESTAAVSDKLGSANIERQGIAYSLTKGTALADGDSIETLDGSTVTVDMDQIGRLTLAGNTRIVYHEAGNGQPSVEVSAGEMFADANAQNDGALVVRVQDRMITASHAVFSLSAPSGSQNVYVYSGNVNFSAGDLAGETSARAGQAATLLAGTSGGTVCTVGTFSATALDDFLIAQVKQSNDADELCFTDEELDKVVDDRQNEILTMEAEQKEHEAQLLAQGGNVLIPVENVGEPDEATSIPRSNSSSSGKKPSSGGSTSGGGSSSNAGSSSASKASPAPAASDNPVGRQTSAPTQEPVSTPKPTEKPKIYTCTISIRCDTILDNMENLTEGKAQYVPANGAILATSSVQFYDGETVFDVLKRACKAAGIQLEYSWTPMYNSYYIEGINHLYEFDCGEESGWMYKVNGWFPNYGCSAYTLRDGDKIVWCFTCNGLGADVGGSVY